MLSAEIIAQIRRIQLRAGHLATDDLAGNYLSAFRGRGMEFDEVRAYQPGDDVRLIDWNVTARTGEPHIKVMREERELTLGLLVDVSASQSFGTGGRNKIEIAAELAAILAYLAIRNNDRVGLLCFSDHVETWMAPNKGRGHVWQIIRTVMQKQGQGTGTDLAGALQHYARRQSRRAMTFVISDFWSPGWEREFVQIARRHDVTAVHIADPWEEAWPDAGVVSWRDQETGEVHWVDTGSARVRMAYEEAMMAREAALKRTVAAAGAGYLRIDTPMAVVPPLLAYLQTRRHRRRRR